MFCLPPKRGDFDDFSESGSKGGDRASSDVVVDDIFFRQREKDDGCVGILRRFVSLFREGSTTYFLQTSSFRVTKTLNV